MATLKEKIDAARTGQLSPEGAEKLKQLILSGKVDAMAQAEGIDLEPFKNSQGKQTVQAPTALTKTAEMVQQKGMGVSDMAAQKSEIIAETGTLTQDIDSPVRQEFEAQQAKEDKLQKAAQFGTAPIGSLISETAKIAGSGLKQVGEGVVEQVKDLTGPLEEQGPIGEGATKVLQGSLQTLFSPLAAVIQNVPGGQKVAEIANMPREWVGDLYGVIAKKAGLDPESPEFIAARDQAMSAFDIGTFLAPAAGATKTGQAIKGKVQGLMSGTKKTATQLNDSFISKVTGLDTNTINTIVDAPDQVKAMSDLTPEISRSNVFTEMKTKIDDIADQKSGIGTLYNDIRATSQVAELPSTAITKWLDNQGLALENGKLSFTNKSKVRSAADVAALQEKLDLYVLDETGAIKPQIEINEFLNFREDLSALAKFDQTKSTNLMSAAKDLRKTVNDDVRTGFDGLESLDSNFASLTQELNSVKDLIYKKDGSLQRNAISNVNNLLNKGKEVQLQAIKDIFPDEASFQLFANDIRAIKAVEDISFAGAQKVGNYTRAILEGGGAAALFATGNPALAVAILLAHPSIASKFLSLYGKTKGKLTQSQIGVLSQKLKDGIEFSEKEAAIMVGLVNSISDEEAYEALLSLQEDLQGDSQGETTPSLSE